jgi:hypothetical protein
MNYLVATKPNFMKTRIIAGSKGLFMVALFFIVLGIVKQLMHVANAIDMYYIAILDAIIAACAFAAVGGLKKAK